MTEKKIQDKELGTITLRRNARNKHYTLKISNGEIVATFPEWGSENKMWAFIEERRKELQEALRRHPRRPILDIGIDIQYTSFRLRIERTNKVKTNVTFRDDVLTLFFPENILIENASTQDVIQNILKNVFRNEAKRLLPSRLSLLAKENGLSYSGLRITSSRTSWGSCSGGKNINLSLYLMQLPWHLIDYVLLHELCHTIEMNHSVRFWQLMDKVTANQSKTLRKELKQYHI